MRDQQVLARDHLHFHLPHAIDQPHLAEADGRRATADRRKHHGDLPRRRDKALDRRVLGVRRRSDRELRAAEPREGAVGRRSKRPQGLIADRDRVGKTGCRRRIGQQLRDRDIPMRIGQRRIPDRGLGEGLSANARHDDASGRCQQVRANSARPQRHFPP